MSELIKEIERQLGYDMIEEGNMSARDVLEIIKNFKQPQLNDNQKNVLEYLKKDEKYRPFRSVGFLDYSNGIIHDRPPKEIYEAYKQLDYDQQFEVLEAFAAWGLEQEEE